MLLATGSVFAIYALLHATLVTLARRSERAAATYPWRGEDYLRYMLPTLFQRDGQDWSIIAGPSEAREDLLHERFEAAFPGVATYQGGLSLGTIDDLLIVLEYLERAYGRGAVPRSLLVGITPRFVANITDGGESPLVNAINRYSPHFRVERAPNGPRLIEKPFAEGLLSRVRFLSKQQGRYHAGLCATVLEQLERGSAVPQNPLLADLGAAPDRLGVGSLAEVLRICRSPYKYHHKRPLTPQMVAGWIGASHSFWYKVHQWDPGADAALVQSRLTRLLEVCGRLGIDLYVVNLPEHPLNRAGYQPGRYQEYLRLVRAAIGQTPFLDLRELLAADEFYDAGHATVRGAIIVTDRTIDFLRANHSAPHGLKAGGAGQSQ